MMTEQMRAQEEEMRQNMEELQATQEKIQRDQLDRESREKIILSGTVLFELNKSFVIRKANNICKEVFKYSPAELEGKMFKDLMVSSSDLNIIQENATSEKYWNGVLALGMLELGELSGNKKYTEFATKNYRFIFAILILPAL